MEKILITGVAGFMGSNLAQYLLKDEYIEIFGVDNFTSSTMSNLYPLLKNDRFHFEEWDLKNELPYTFEKVYHLAGCGDLRRYYENKSEYCFEQIEIIKNIINSTIQNGAKLITTTSYKNLSSENDDNKLLFDTQNFIETLLLELINQNKLNANLARIDNVYGINMIYGDNRYIPLSIISALQNTDITNNSEEYCYYTYIDDVITNLSMLMNNYVSTPIVDIMSKNLYLKSDIIKLIIKCSKSQSNYIQDGLIEPILPNYTPKETEFKCETSVLEGIAKTVQHMKLMYFS